MKQLKGQNPEIVIHHVLDRGFDDVAYFEKLSDLADSRFVIRLKNWRSATGGMQMYRA